MFFAMMLLSPCPVSRACYPVAAGCGLAINHSIDLVRI